MKVHGKGQPLLWGPLHGVCLPNWKLAGSAVLHRPSIICVAAKDRGSSASTQVSTAKTKTPTAAPRIVGENVPAATPATPNSSTKQGLLHKAIQGLLHSPHDAAIFNLAVPAVIALATDPLLGVVDTAVVGQLGEIPLAALGVNNSLFSFAFVVFNFLAVATTPTIAAALGAQNRSKAGETTLQALLLALVLGVAVTAGLILNADTMLSLMGLDRSDPHLWDLARGFLLVRATAAPAALAITVSQGVFRGLQDMRTPLYITLGTNLLHLVLDYCLIFHAGLGVSGAAWSTSIAEWLAAFVYLQLGWRRRSDLGLDLPLRALDLRDLVSNYLPFLQAGGAVLMRTVVLLGTKTLVSAVATRIGTTAIASHQVLTQVWVLSSMVVDALAIAGQTLVAIRLGQGDRAGARQVTDRLLQLGLALGLALAALLSSTSPLWPHLFTQDEGVLGSVQSLLPLALALLPSNALVYVLDGVLVGASDFHFLVGAMALSAGATAGTLLVLEPMGLGLQGVWISLSLLMLLRLATLGWRYQSEAGPLPPSCTTNAATASAIEAVADGGLLPPPGGGTGGVGSTGGLASVAAVAATEEGVVPACSAGEAEQQPGASITPSSSLHCNKPCSDPHRARQDERQRQEQHHAPVDEGQERQQQRLADRGRQEPQLGHEERQQQQTE